MLLSADHYSLFSILKFMQGSGPKGDNVLQNGEYPSISGGRGFLRGDRAKRGVE